MSIEALLTHVILEQDKAQERRLPIGSLVRMRVQGLSEFQAAYTSSTWNEKKEKEMDAKTLKKRPPHRVLSHAGGWVRLRPVAGGSDFLSLPREWEPG